MYSETPFKSAIMTKYTIATWNVNSLRVRLPHVLAWLERVKPDILALQETKVPDTDFPIDAFQSSGYQVIFSGQKAWNGVAILSRNKASADIVTDLPEFEDTQRRVLATVVDNLRILNVYIPNGESITSDKYQYKLNWLNKFDLFLKREIQQYPQIVVLGDFNIAPDEIDVHDPKLWDGKVIFSQPERKAFSDMLQIGFRDCFRQFNPEEKSYSWWDYRMNAFKRNLGLRIDHIIASDKLAAQCAGCYIDKEPRSKDRPSDHAPVVAEFILSH